MMKFVAFPEGYNSKGRPMCTLHIERMCMEDNYVAERRTESNAVSVVDAIICLHPQGHASTLFWLYNRPERSRQWCCGSY